MSTLPVVTLPSGLPALDPESLAHGRQIHFYLTERIRQANGWLAFEDWMQAALYAPGLGYYSAGSTKLNLSGDFTTAPEISPLFGQTLARQIAQILHATDSTQVLEFGAGSGALAAALIPTLQAMGLDVDYQIIELSADLRERQTTRLAHLQPSVQWRDTLPEAFIGCVLANEVLDAMPATLFRWNEAGVLMELGVSLDDQADAVSPFCYAERPASEALFERVAQRMPPLAGYRSEINVQAEAWIRQMGQWLTRGVALLIDYGFPQHEYYHPQRAQGTLMCHFRHYAHDQALVLAGLQDITTHVDFTAMADAALEGGLDVLGYTAQARFLMNSGLTDLIAQPDSDPTIRTQQLTAVNTLVSEAEMGELFKVLAIGRDVDGPLLGFMLGDRRDRL